MAQEQRLASAETLLQANGFSEGLFLVREKTDNGLCYVLSMVYRGKPLHLLLEQDHPAAPFKVNGDMFGSVGPGLAEVTTAPSGLHSPISLTLITEHNGDRPD